MKNFYIYGCILAVVGPIVGYQPFAGSRAGEEWRQIGVSLTTRFVDTIEPASEDGCEIREYRVQGLNGSNHRIGDLSNVARAATLP